MTSEIKDQVFLQKLEKLASPEHIDFLFEYLESIDRVDLVEAFNVERQKHSDAHEACHKAYLRMIELLSPQSQ